MRDAYSILNRYFVGMVLDAATGRGDFIHVLKKNLGSYTQIIGVDASEKQVDQAQKHFPENDVEIFRMDLEDLQFAGGLFDLVSISSSLHHLENLKQVTAELLRVLKPGGTLLISEMYSDGEQSEPQQTHIQLHHWLAGVDTAFGIYHRSTFTRAEILGLVKNFKLQKVKVTDFYEPVDNPKESRNCENLMRNCTETFKRLENLPDGEALLSEGQAIMERINKVGCAGASRLLVTGCKPAAKSGSTQKGDR